MGNLLAERENVTDSPQLASEIDDFKLQLNDCHKKLQAAAQSDNQHAMQRTKLEEQADELQSANSALIQELQCARGELSVKEIIIAELGKDIVDSKAKCNALQEENSHNSQKLSNYVQEAKVYSAKALSEILEHQRHNSTLDSQCIQLENQVRLQEKREKEFDLQILTLEAKNLELISQLPTKIAKTDALPQINILPSLSENERITPDSSFNEILPINERRE